jgi:hypothetical protein
MRGSLKQAEVNLKHFIFLDIIDTEKIKYKHPWR